VTLQQVEYFLAVARAGSFSRAAADLHVAQPSVSEQLRKLERELGAPLFTRRPRGVELTEAGRAFRPYAERVLAELENGRRAVLDQAQAVRGRVRIGAPPTVGTHVLPSVLASFRARYAEAELVLTQAPTRLIIDALLRGELDLAVAQLPAARPELASLELFSEDLVAVVAADHPLAHQQDVALADLADQPFVLPWEGYELRATVVNACEAAGFTPRVGAEAGDLDTVLRFVGAGLGVSIVPRLAIEPELPSAPVALPLREPKLRRHLGLLWPRARYQPAVVKALRDHLAAALRQARPAAG